MNRVIICANKKLPLLFENYCDSYLGNGFSNGKCENCPFCDHLKKCNAYFGTKIVVPLSDFSIESKASQVSNHQYSNHKKAN